MECHEGATMIKTFRGSMLHNTQDTIVLHTNDGSMGYRIVKLELIGAEPGEQSQESTVKIYKVSQTTVDNTIDFSDNTLLAAGYYQDGHEVSQPSSLDIIFDKEVFNQDIYVTNHNSDGSYAINYYIELEQVKLDIGENTVATLKDIRNTKASPV